MLDIPMINNEQKGSLSANQIDDSMEAGEIENLQPTSSRTTMATFLVALGASAFLATLLLASVAYFGTVKSEGAQLRTERRSAEDVETYTWDSGFTPSINAFWECGYIQHSITHMNRYYACRQRGNQDDRFVLFRDEQIAEEQKCNETSCDWKHASSEVVKLARDNHGVLTLMEMPPCYSFCDAWSGSGVLVENFGAKLTCLWSPVNVALDWHGAEQYCESYSDGYGHLVEPNYPNKNELVHRLFREGLDRSDNYMSPWETHKRMWIGGSAGTDRVFRWVSGGVVSEGWSRWADQEPNDFGGNEDCMEMPPVLTEAVWNDNDCGKEFRFACERPEPPAYSREVCQIASFEIAPRVEFPF